MNVSQPEKTPHFSFMESSKESKGESIYFLYFQISEIMLSFDVFKSPLHETLNVNMET